MAARALHFYNKKFFLKQMSRTLSTTSQKLNEATEELKLNPFYDKYAKKIASLQQTSPEEFLSRIDATKVSGKSTANNTRKIFESGSPKPFVEMKQQFTKPKQLSDIMKIELLNDKSADNIKQIWLDYHKSKDVIAGVIPTDTYKTIHERSKEHNTFLLPLPRNQGYEFIVLQFYGEEVHFTPLIAYQTHKENAPECLTIVHYSELADTKGIVLMKGEYNTDVLQAHEAQCLVNELQLYYAHNNEKRIKMLHRFTYAPNEFKHMDLIAELECLSL